MLLEKFPSLAIPEVTRWVTAGLLHIPLRIHQAQEHRNSWAGAPEEGPPAKESHGLYTPHCPHKSRSSSQVFGSCSISASIHSAGFTALHLLWYPKGQQFPAPAVSPTIYSSGWSHQSFMLFVIPKLGYSWPLVSGFLTELSLHFNLHLNFQAELPGPEVCSAAWGIW